MAATGEVHGDRVVFSVADTEVYTQWLIICSGRLSRDSNFVLHPCHFSSVRFGVEGYIERKP